MKSMRKRGEVETDFHPEYQPLIEAIGTANVLENFAYTLGRDGLATISGDDSGPIASRIRTTNSIPDTFSGVAFDGAHWKGYEPKRPDGYRVVYDSYLSNIQLPGTNNFCQAYATFLWARGGALDFKGRKGTGININLVPGRYTDNVMQMAKLWLTWIETMESYSDSNKWLVKAIPNIEMVKRTIKKLSEDRNEASEFSKSK